MLQLPTPSHPISQNLRPNHPQQMAWILPNYIGSIKLIRKDRLLYRASLSQSKDDQEKQTHLPCTDLPQNTKVTLRKNFPGSPVLLQLLSAKTLALPRYVTLRLLKPEGTSSVSNPLNFLFFFIAPNYGWSEFPLWNT